MTFCRPSALLASIAALCVSPLLSAQAPAPSIAGDWTGVLTASAGDRHITLHLVQSGGTYTCTIDSPDQGAMGVECTLDSAVNPVVFEVPIVNGKWTGTLSGDTLKGSWSQGGEPKELDMTRLGATPAPAQAVVPAAPAVSAVGATDNVSGLWKGEIDTGHGSLHIVLHLHNDVATPTCTLDSPDQGASDIPCTLKVSANHVDVEVPVVHGHWAGDVTPGLLSGTWTQGANSLPLVFKMEPAAPAAAK
jgi:hypothetical protein